jgi:tetratricopeptide (TPR) repeat protein
MRSSKFFIVAGFLILLGTSGFLVADDRMVERLQGKWSRTQTGPQGETIRVEKHFDGPNETFTVYRNGEQIYAHVAKNYRINVINEDEQLYAYSVNGFKVTAGPNEGQQLDQLIEYLFCIKGDQFIEMAGILQHDPRQPSLTVYEHVEDKDGSVSAGQLLKLGVEKLEAEEYEEAIKLFAQLAEQSPTATNYALIGDCYWKQMKLDEADVHYRRALELDPKHCGANHALGRDAVLQKRYQDSMAYLDSANEVCTGTILHAQNLRFRVEALLELDRVAEAESDMQKLTSAYPDDPNTFYAGMLVAKSKGDEVLAEQYKAKLDAISNEKQP